VLSLFFLCCSSNIRNQDCLIVSEDHKCNVSKCWQGCRCLFDIIWLSLIGSRSQSHLKSTSIECGFGESVPSGCGYRYTAWTYHSKVISKHNVILNHLQLQALGHVGKKYCWFIMQCFLQYGLYPVHTTQVHGPCSLFSMTLNGEFGCFAGQLRHSGWRQTYNVRKILSPISSLPLLAITNPTCSMVSLR